MCDSQKGSQEIHNGRYNINLEEMNKKNPPYLQKDMNSKIIQNRKLTENLSNKSTSTPYSTISGPERGINKDTPQWDRSNRVVGLNVFTNGDRDSGGLRTAGMYVYICICIYKYICIC
jgi:hypothetical protein